MQSDEGIDQGNVPQFVVQAAVDHGPDSLNANHN